MYLVLVTGSRNWTNAASIRAELDKLPADTFIIQGGADGADRIAADYAMKLGFLVLTAHANWFKFKKAAGPIRNKAMLEMKPAKVLAFCLNQSKGTMDCITAALGKGIPVEIFT